MNKIRQNSLRITWLTIYCDSSGQTREMFSLLCRTSVIHITYMVETTSDFIHISKMTNIEWFVWELPFSLPISVGISPTYTNPTMTLTIKLNVLHMHLTRKRLSLPRHQSIYHMRTLHFNSLSFSFRNSSVEKGIRCHKFAISRLVCSAQVISSI